MFDKQGCVIVCALELLPQYSIAYKSIKQKSHSLQYAEEAYVGIPQIISSKLLSAFDFY